MLIDVMWILIVLKFLNSVNPELQVKDNESAIRNKLKVYCLDWGGLNSWQH